MESKEQATVAGFPEGAWRAAKSCGPNGGNCVEVNLGAREVIGVRDSKAGPGPVLTFGQSGWERFLGATKVGRRTPD